jgi:hypothetical protein
MPNICAVASIVMTWRCCLIMLVQFLEVRIYKQITSMKKLRFSIDIKAI